MPQSVVAFKAMSEDLAPPAVASTHPFSPAVPGPTPPSIDVADLPAYAIGLGASPEQIADSIRAAGSAGKYKPVVNKVCLPPTAFPSALMDVQRVPGQGRRSIRIWMVGDCIYDSMTCGHSVVMETLKGLQVCLFVRRACSVCCRSSCWQGPRATHPRRLSTGPTS